MLYDNDPCEIEEGDLEAARCRVLLLAVLHRAFVDLLSPDYYEQNDAYQWFTGERERERERERVTFKAVVEHIEIKASLLQIIADRVEDIRKELDIVREEMHKVHGESEAKGKANRAVLLYLAQRKRHRSAADSAVQWQRRGRRSTCRESSAMACRSEGSQKSGSSTVTSISLVEASKKGL